MKHLPVTLILLLFQIQIVCAQSGKIIGSVYDKNSGKTLSNVNIKLLPLGVGAVTEIDGSYTLIEIPEGTYRMVSSHIGYIEQSRKVIMHPGKRITSDIYLVPKVEELEEVSVEGLGPEITPYRIDRVNLLEIREAVTTDIGTFLRTTPNVSGIRKGGTNIDPVIRGFKFSQLNVQINNGIKIEGGCPNRMDPATSHVEINDVDAINIYKGPYALRFGPNMGGIIQIKTLQPKQYKKFKTEITAIQGFESNLNSTISHLDMEGGNRFFFFNLSGNYNRANNYKAGNGEPISSSYTKYNYSAQLGFNPVKNHGFNLSFDESFGRNVMFPALPMDERSDDTRIMSFHYKGTELSKCIQSISLSAYRSRVNHVMDNKQRPFSDTIVAVSTIKAINYGGRGEINFQFGKHHFFTGIDYEHIYKDGIRTKSLILQPNLPVKTEQLWDDARIRNVGIFTEYNTSAGVFDIVAALRVDFNNATCRLMEALGMNGQVIYSDPDVNSSFINLSVSAGAIYHMTKNLNINLALGRSVRSPDMVERFIM
ncbi:MAG: TonB-dependent receptor, partial [Bacteroidia bacterium]|nr:TonB-dependent receptor [Bacteroidia bacterium]